MVHGCMVYQRHYTTSRGVHCTRRDVCVCVCEQMCVHSGGGGGGMQLIIGTIIRTVHVWVVVYNN